MTIKFELVLSANQIMVNKMIYNIKQQAHNLNLLKLVFNLKRSNSLNLNQ